MDYQFYNKIKKECKLCGCLLPDKIEDIKEHICNPHALLRKVTEPYHKEEMMNKENKEEHAIQIAIDETKIMDLAQRPKTVIENAVEAAKELKAIVDKKPKKVIINNEQYLEFEDWQTLGKFYGLFVKTGEPEFITIDDVKGFKAQAKVVTRTGIEVGGATAYCMRDEKNWTEKPTFQLASMAQTRAAAKALRNMLAWVAVLAGYRPTPAEEIVDTNNSAEHKETPVTPKGVLTIAEALKQPVNSTFDVQGILSDYKTETIIKKDKTKTDITHYKILTEDSQFGMTISKWGKCPENIKLDDVIMFILVKTSEFKEQLKYLASNIDLVKTVKER